MTMKSTAVFSDDRLYRYALGRTWNPDTGLMVVIGLNPSTADETVDDPTIRRCIGFAKREHCGGLIMLNLFALRETHPSLMMAVGFDAVGPANDIALRSFCQPGDLIVAAWGTHGAHQERDRAVMALGLPPMMCFGRTNDGLPRHPLYMPKDAPLTPYTGRP